MTAIVHLAPGIDVVLRQNKREDERLILSTWKRGYIRAPEMVWLQRYADGEHVGFAELNRRCDRLLDKYGAVVACHPINEDEILGWACTDRARNICHYVFVQRAFRNFGIGRLLLGGLSQPIICTHWSEACEHAQRKMQLHYVPSARGI